MLVSKTGHRLLYTEILETTQGMRSMRSMRTRPVLVLVIADPCKYRRSYIGRPLIKSRSYTSLDQSRQCTRW